MEEQSWTFLEIIAEFLECEPNQVQCERYEGIPDAKEEKDMGGVYYFVKERS